LIGVTNGQINCGPARVLRTSSVSGMAAGVDATASRGGDEHDTLMPAFHAASSEVPLCV